jgi:cyclic pyranopterin phosphate synthase
MERTTAAKIAGHGLVKGDVLGIARIAAIQGAKRTSELLPLAEDVLLGAIEIDFVLSEESVTVSAQVISRDGRGVEMEALTACSIAGLTIYDMCKAIDRSMSISQLKLDA